MSERPKRERKLPEKLLEDRKMPFDDAKLANHEATKNDHLKYQMMRLLNQNNFLD